MSSKKTCSMMECLKTKRRELVGAVFLLIAALLTILTFSGIGIFGMFIAGTVLCCHGHMCCKSGCHEGEHEAVKKAPVKRVTKTATKTTK